jgi:hypothetical protein
MGMSQPLLPFAKISHPCHLTHVSQRKTKVRQSCQGRACASGGGGGLGWRVGRLRWNTVLIGGGGANNNGRPAAHNKALYKNNVPLMIHLFCLARAGGGGGGSLLFEGALPMPKDVDSKAAAVFLMIPPTGRHKRLEM